MIKVFTKNKNNKIELSEKELKELLDEAYWDGYRSNTSTYVYSSPLRSWWDPYVYTTTGTSVTLSNNITTEDNITLNTTASNNLNADTKITWQNGDH